jgi:hypothetical protein
MKTGRSQLVIVPYVLGYYIGHGHGAAFAKLLLWLCFERLHHRFQAGKLGIFALALSLKGTSGGTVFRPGTIRGVFGITDATLAECHV